MKNAHSTKQGGINIRVTLKKYIVRLSEHLILTQGVSDGLLKIH